MTTWPLPNPPRLDECWTEEFSSLELRPGNGFIQVTCPLGKGKPVQLLLTCSMANCFLICSAWKLSFVCNILTISCSSANLVCSSARLSFGTELSTWALSCCSSWSYRDHARPKFVLASSSYVARGESMVKKALLRTVGMSMFHVRKRTCSSRTRSCSPSIQLKNKVAENNHFIPATQPATKLLLLFQPITQRLIDLSLACRRHHTK